MNNRHPWQLKKSKSWRPFWSYQLNSTANLANLAQFWGKWAGLAVLFSWYLQNGSQDFHFFNCPGCQIFISLEIHCYLCPHIFWVYYFSIRQYVIRSKIYLLWNRIEWFSDVKKYDLKPVFIEERALDIIFHIICIN